jgi:tetratricopeptide (TPR) repeat protein
VTRNAQGKTVAQQLPTSPFMRVTRIAFSLVAVLVCALPSVAAPHSEDDDVLAGYRQFYGGDARLAQKTFEGLVTARPDRLAAQFGLATVLEDRSRDERGLEPEFERRIDALLAAADARVNRSATDDEALFYLANGHLLRAKYRFDHDKGVWGAARDGARSKRFSEQYIRRRPEHGDAYLALGTYNYYVEIAPAFVKVLRAFLFLPAGNRALGLEQLERAYAQGNLFAPQAGLALMDIYGSFEPRAADALRVGEQLASRYPDNPKIQFTLAEVYASPAIEDHQRAAATFERIVAYEDRRQGPERRAKYDARLGLAAERFSSWRTDEALAVLDDVIARRPAAPTWVMPNFLLRRSNYRALVNDPRAADDAKAVLAEATWKEWHGHASERLKWLERWRSSGEGSVFAALIPGNRLVDARQWDEAAASYEQVRQQYANNPQVRFRIAVLTFRRGDAPRARPEFQSVAASAAAPEWLKAQALLMAARTDDLEGRRSEAVAGYRRIVDDYGRESAVWAAKVGLVTPYRRPGM